MGNFRDTKEPLLLVCVANMNVAVFSRSRGLGLNDPSRRFQKLDSRSLHHCHHPRLPFGVVQRESTSDEVMRDVEDENDEIYGKSSI